MPLLGHSIATQCVALPPHYIYYDSKVENILKGRLDSIPSPSPSVTIQIMGGKIGLRCKNKTLLDVVNKYFVYFPAHNLNFHW